jgi:hypothetical protein
VENSGSSAQVVEGEVADRMILPLGAIRGNPVVDDVVRRMTQHKAIQRHHLEELLRCAMIYAKQGGQLSERYERCMIFAILVVHQGEWFDFGSLTNDLFLERTFDAIPLMANGLLRMPYECTIFTHTFKFDAVAPSNENYVHQEPWMQDFYLVVDPRISDLDIPEAKDHDFLIMEFRIEIFQHLGWCLMPRIVVGTSFTPTSSDASYRAEVFFNPLELDDTKLAKEVNSACDPVAVLNIVLNTKNVRLDRIEISPKLNRARERQRKPPLKSYTVVHTNEYISAMREGVRMAAAGTHASPRPHLRRGHIRHLVSHKEIWIHDTIVNAHKGEWATRLGYKVRP